MQLHSINFYDLLRPEFLNANKNDFPLFNASFYGFCVSYIALLQTRVHLISIHKEIFQPKIFSKQFNCSGCVHVKYFNSLTSQIKITFFLSFFRIEIASSRWEIGIGKSE
jgi:hypothetical protein